MSDQRMPEMSGVEFLSQVKELYPETVRIVLSGFTDLASVTDAINKGAIYRFLTKPWDDELLRENIEEAFRLYELVRENERLAMELRVSNEFLKKANQELEEYTMLNFHTLHASQEALESLPVGVIGMGDDNVVEIANKKSHELLKAGSCDLIGRPGSEVLPPQLYALCLEGEMGKKQLLELQGGGAMEVFTYRQVYSFGETGTLLVLLPGDVAQ